MSRIVIAGASGLIGQPLVRALRAGGHRVTTLVRRAPKSANEVRWDPDAGQLDPAVLTGADAVINLSGASIARIPWTNSYRRELVSSRINATRLLAETMAGMPAPPATFLSGSAIGFYGDRPRVRLDDDSPRGSGFVPDLVLAWEQAAGLAPPQTRVVTLRTSVVVAKSGGLAPVRLLTTFGLGARFGSGRQFWPWISLEDEVRAIVHLLTSTISGPVVLAGPTPATADEITAAYAEALRRPRFLWVPAWAIRLALGDAGEHLLLADVQLQPVRLAADGFEWRHRTVRDAIDAALAG
ncbi:TIGR01777 family oxidoreductase [Pseudolysinimonas yzui]|uniref:Epimerase n=1 Tax=Pseudolysinimonas yzui TaxID=2708254 RepID=A0A8J3M3D3_9MICO|nr:TIGR01777 family oxidoreductase [Pseudolysinimonas yzui]GHF11361.1 epimerase [Pseudolysinimonas yzui]